jgi:plasmid stability protein
MERRHDRGLGEPMTLTIHLPDDLERRLRERASRDGRSVEGYVLKLIERDATGPFPGPVVDASGVQPGQGPALSDDQFESLLDDLASGPERPHLPADFSRADIYADHD